jgi:YjbE family integral membrane protein
MNELMTPAFWTGFIAIIGIDIILSGDNAVVIALAARSLPPKQQKAAVFWGAGAAVMLRVMMAAVALQLLRLPYLKLAGGAMLLWIAVKLLTPADEDHNIAPADHLAAAIKTIVVADFVMSLDNVVAVAGAAKGSVLLLALGLIISIPLVVFGATMLMKWMERWPVIITIGSAILGWVAVEMLITDPVVAPYLHDTPGYVHYLMSAVGAVFVVAVGKWFALRNRIARSTAAERKSAS